jgi:hypothetical protein
LKACLKNFTMRGFDKPLELSSFLFSHYGDQSRPVKDCFS